jgi:hypothetical protein
MDGKKGIAYFEAIELQTKPFSEALEAFRNSEKAKNEAYTERNKLVCLLSKVFPAWLERHPVTDKDWEHDWRNIVFIQLPTGQASWHIHDSEARWFDHLKMDFSKNSWDGHTTEEKYRRVMRVKPAILVDVRTTSVEAVE